MIDNQVMSYRRALEALRNGVPNRDAVAVLGCNQPHVESTFVDFLTRAADRDNPPPSSMGMLVSGDFGSGKSHLLEHLEHQALSQNFLCSRVAISKETPLFNLEKVFKSAIDHGRLPHRTGHMIEELGQGLKSDSEDYSRFFVWANSEECGLNRFFPATLIVHERCNDLEFQNDVQWFWSGNKLAVSRLKNGLRQINQLQTYSFRAPKASELHPQRLRFVLELIKGAGYKGWVVLLDEVELVASYSLLQRGRSYAELARWMGKVSGEEYPGLVVVGTLAVDFPQVVLEQKGDRDYIGPRLRQRGRDEYNIIASRAETGMRLLEREPMQLQEPTADTVETALDKLRHIYSIGYNWDAPTIEPSATGAGYQRRMRFHIRKSINEWDLMRLYPDARPETEGTDFRFRYEEDATLERETKDDSDQPGQRME